MADVDDFAAKRLQHVLHVGIAFGVFAETLLFEAGFVFGAACFGLGLGVFDCDAQRCVSSGYFATGGADQFGVFGFEECLAQVAIFRCEFDEELGVVESRRQGLFERSDQQHLALCF